ncbi:MAG: hypothetical protein KGH65_03695 [Candidatus Micrarchaeota archaeon]|nr:hypothetical protein [Candidatus Micrarchaeota archaeon]
MKDTRYIRIGYGTEFTTFSSPFTGIVAALAGCVDAYGLPLEFQVIADESPAQRKALDDNKKAADAEMESQGKRWYEEYIRANKLEQQLKELQQSATSISKGE